MIVTPTNKSVTELDGLHLYHADMSNCSMRVRMTLEEKHLPWISHHLDLRKKEAVTPDYFGIHPKGLVPTLVHDGVVHIESNEIIEYLDETFPDPPLRPDSPEERDELRDWLRTATEIHVPAVKTLIYTRKIGKMLRKKRTRTPSTVRCSAIPSCSLFMPPPRAEAACRKRMSTKPKRRYSDCSTRSKLNCRSTNGWSATNSRWPTFPGCRCTLR